jgi:hypothetical protein
MNNAKEQSKNALQDSNASKENIARKRMNNMDKILGVQKMNLLIFMFYIRIITI